MAAVAKLAPAEPLSVEFDDNSVLSMLYGEHDRHLSRIEQLLGVTIATRGSEPLDAHPGIVAPRA